MDFDNWLNDPSVGDASSTAGTEADEFLQPYSLRDATLIVLDCNASMFSPLVKKQKRGNQGPAGDDDSATDEGSDEENDDEMDVDPTSPGGQLRRIPFYMSIQVLCEVLREKAISYASDFVGLLLFNTKTTNIDSPGLYQFLPLDQPEPSAILSMWELGQGEVDFDPIGSSITPSNMAEVLANALRQFRSLLAHWTRHNHTEQDQARRTIRTRLDDLRTAGIQFSPYFLPPADGSTFRMDLFWSDLLEDPTVAATSQDRNLEDSPYAPITSNLVTVAPSYRALHQGMDRRESKRRTAFRVPFHISDQLTVGVRGFILYSEAHKPAATKVLAETLQKVVPVRQSLCPSTTQVLTKDQMVTVYHLVDTPVKIAPERLESLTDYGSPRIQLLGFKPRRKLRRAHNVTHSTLLVPDETQFAGSTASFVSLLEQMHLQNVFALVMYYPRVNMTPRLAALIPQWEQYDKFGMVRPSGLVAIPLPFKEELRHIEWPVGDLLKKPTPAEAAGRDPAEALLDPVVKRWIGGAFDPQDYMNPTLARFRVKLHAKALDRELPMPTDEDCAMLPDFDLWHERAAARAQLFVQTLGQCEPKAPAPSAAARERASRPTFDASAEDGGAGVVAQMEQVWKNGKVDKCKVADLKAVLGAVGLKVSGLKADLVERVCEYFESRS
ncbi:SPOC like C-terminal domain-containing protein [Catenaria anguillulae PL171]|uniref:ATP-dependent DNA helicase II subunit 1 n=1 Tax=Catenaria anguillulae PL171 TaxID=765915 RepID=A0A1Y2HV41_9FUNG|nr:SPOC like C-terminal domain-containing protein [Catenaria anguillulae PL171]